MSTGRNVFYPPLTFSAFAAGKIGETRMNRRRRRIDNGPNCAVPARAIVAQHAWSQDIADDVSVFGDFRGIISLNLGSIPHVAGVLRTSNDHLRC
jgi:hypothetical protein